MTHGEIHRICKKYKIIKYTINDDMSIDVDGNVNLCSKKLKKLPLKFNYVSGNFLCSDNQLISLKGSPKEVGGNFDCSNNKLTSLEGAPLKVVFGSFCCRNSAKLKYSEYLKSIKRLNKLKQLDD